MDAIYRPIASLVMGLMSAIGFQAPPATWQLRVMLDGKSVALTISDHPHSSHGMTVPIDQFDGVLRGSAGGGTMEFVASETFPIELAKRGFDTPSRVDQMKMAWHDTGFAFIDELAARKYQRPALQQLVNAGDHGVDRVYVREMSALGLKGLNANDLVRARDHGVGPDYVRDMRALGYVLTIDQLVAARDHSITPQYARLRGAAPIERLISLHDHGQ